jgi:hypothetical protein
LVTQRIVGIGDDDFVGLFERSEFTNFRQKI